VQEFWLPTILNNFHTFAERNMFSTVFSTVVEILGKKPKHLLVTGRSSGVPATVTQDLWPEFFDTLKEGRLLLRFRIIRNHAFFESHRTQ